MPDFATGDASPRASAPSRADSGLGVLRDLFAGYYPRDFDVRLWDGTVWPAETNGARFTLVLNHRGAMRSLFWPPSQLTMAEAYVHGDVDIEGDIHGVFPLADHLLVDRDWTFLERLKLGARMLALPGERRSRESRAASLRGRRFSLARDGQAVSYHYDRSNEFFSVYLDSRMVYSCAYFASPVTSLDVAQEQKLDILCRKLRLRPGERLLDIGCGFGALIMHATQRFGVEAVGITISERQADLARERIAAAGLTDCCRVAVVDYRQLDEPETYDKVVSVCMFEQVPEHLLPEFFARARTLLRPGGVFVNQGIARHVDFEQSARRGDSFIDRYVFPDGGVVPISTTLAAAEGAGLEVRDVESLREHYVLTLRHWVSRLEGNRDAAIRAIDELTYRVWRLYMAGSAYGFETGRLNVYQTVFAKPAQGRTGLPLTRDDWY
jgi:cyclopropane-fatty-acyl-phospholipid synthase